MIIKIQGQSPVTMTVENFKSSLVYFLNTFMIIRYIELQTFEKYLAFFAMIIMLTVPNLAFGQTAQKQEIITIPSSYSNKPLALDGYDDDWKDIKNNELTFQGKLLPSTSSNNNNAMIGKIMARNNVSNLALFIKMKTLYPVTDQHRILSLALYKNSDGRSTTGDNVITIKANGPRQPTILGNYYFNEQGEIKPNPIKPDAPKNAKTSQAYLRSISDSETSLEIIIPIKDTDTKNLYNFQMNTGGELSTREFGIGLIYSVGEPNSPSSSTFFAGFSYSMAQDPQLAFIPGLKTFSIFVISVIITLAVVIIFASKDFPKRIRVPKKISIIVLLVLFTSIIIVVLDVNQRKEFTSHIQPLSKVTLDQGLIESGFYASILGVIPALLAFRLFKQSENIVSKLAFDQKILLKSTIVFFLLLLIRNAVPPFIFVLMGVTAFLNHAGVESLRPHMYALEEIAFHVIGGMIILPVTTLFEIWIPIVFLIFILYNMQSSHIRTRSKLLLIFIGLIPLITITITTIVYSFVPLETQRGYLLLLLGPTMATIISSFLAAQGYVISIRENLRNIKDDPAATYLDKYNPKIFNIFRTFGIKLFAIFHLIINAIGLSRGLFLLAVVFGSMEFPLGYSLISGTFANIVSNYATASMGQNLAAAKIVYNSFWIFISLFFIYDIVMILKGFSNEFLASENLAYGVLRRHVGLLTAICFLALVIVLAMVNDFVVFREDEAQRALPTWVKQQIGIQAYQSPFLSNLQSQLGFLAGVSTLLGIIYLMLRSKSLFQKNQPNTSMNTKT